MASLWAQSALAYCYLSEYVTADGSDYHTGLTGDAVLSTDVLTHPKWRSSDFPLQLRLCTTNLNSNSNMRYTSSRDTELTNDITSAGSAWANVPTTILSPTPKTSLTFGSVSESCTETTPVSSDTTQLIKFGTLSAGVLAYTSITYTVSAGELIIEDAYITFNTNSFKFSTSACNPSSGTGTCQTSGTVYSFLGVLTHELGHLLGLCHSMVNDDNSSDGIDTMATMFPAVSTRTESVSFETLQSDDELSLLNLYPPTSFPSSNNGGTISGYVKQSGPSGQRGAHVTVWDATNNRSIGGVFSGMSGTAGSTDGAFTIKGIPYNTDVKLFVEPADRSSDVHSNLVYTAYNTPVQLALQTNGGSLRSFAIEGYPDVRVANVRVTGNASTSPAFTNAQTIRLTSSAQSASNINFYLSSSFTAPNDSVGTTLTILPYGTSGTSNASIFSIRVLTNSSPSIFTNPTLTLTATNGGTSLNWVSAIGSPTDSEGTRIYPVSPSALTAANSNTIPVGVYSITASLTDSTYGTFTSDALSLQLNADGTSGTFTGGGGGCNLRLDQKENQYPPSLTLMILFGLFVFFRRRFQNQ